MSFSTGHAQRRGAQAATVGTSIKNTAQSQIPFPQLDLINQPLGPNRATKKKRKIAAIGSDDSIGLVIHGKRGIDTFEGTDPDSAVPPISGATLQNPDFPISYNGRGTLKFVSPIRITTIDGPLNVNGEVYSSSGLLGPAAAAANALSWESGMTMGATGAGANLTIDGPATYCTSIVLVDNVTLHVHIAWSGKGSVVDGDSIFIKGLPYTNETQTQIAIVSCTNVTPVQLGSYFLVKNADSPANKELQLYSSDSGTGLDVPITGLQLGSTGTISFNMNYHAVVP